MGYRICVLDPGSDSPAGSVADRHLQADYLDAAALDAMAQLCRAATTEFENVPAQALRRLAQRCVVSPAAEAVAVAQDRIEEKRFVTGCRIPVAPHAAIRDRQDLQASGDALYPGILKVARLGYDGKGQQRVGDRHAALAAFDEFGGVPCVLERALALKLEVSVVIARGFDGAAVAYPVSQNVHRGGILAVSTVPADVGRSLAERATAAASRIAQALDYVGVLCVEFFVLDDGELLVNELAPRPHNSGHYTIDACVTSQFEQQARILAGLPLGSVGLHQPAVMLNILGDAWLRDAARTPVEPDWTEVLRHPTAKLHLYGKSEPRRGRKMGHVTVLGDSAADATRIAGEIAAALGIG